MLKMFHSAKTTSMALSTSSRTKKIPPKRVRAAFAKNEELFAAGGPRCPVKLLKTFLSHRPEEMKSNGPIYLAVIERPKSQVWYKRQRMGIHSINSFTKSMTVQAENKVKRLTNHSARKTLVKKLKTANQPCSVIIGVTGYKRALSSRLHG